MEDKVYCRFLGEPSQSQGPLGESGVDMITLSCFIWGGEREMGGRSQEAQGYKEIRELKWLDYTRAAQLPELGGSG